MLLSCPIDAHAFATVFIHTIRKIIHLSNCCRQNFCFHYSRKIHLSTDQFGGRKVGGDAYGDEVIAFGESQLLGLDFSDTESSQA